MKLVKTLQSKLAVSSAATTALAADQGTQHRQRAALFFLAPRFSFVLCLVTCLAALLAASLDKLNAREKELLDSKGFVESKRSERVKEVAQLEESLKGERKCC
jgi:hypothetical protein